MKNGTKYHFVPASVFKGNFWLAIGLSISLSRNGTKGCCGGRSGGEAKVLV